MNKIMSRLLASPHLVLCLVHLFCQHNVNESSPTMLDEIGEYRTKK